MAKKPPTYTVPPAPPKKGGSTGAAFNTFINAHPTMRPYADTIWKWAGVYGIDKVAAAALFWKESFAAAKAQGVDPATIESPTHQGVGIGQINPNHVGTKTPWGHVVSQSDLTNPAFNIRWSMWYFGQQVGATGDYDQAYARYAAGPANPAAYTGPALSTYLPKGYVPKSGLSPTDKGTVAAETAAATKAAKVQTFDKWAVLTNKGQVAFTNIADPANPPKNVLLYGGTPVTQTTFTQTWKNAYKDQFYSFTGRQASGKEIATILAGAPSVWTLQNQLAGNVPSPIKNTSFQHSPVWKQHAPGLIAIARSILGNDWKPSGGIIRRAIAGAEDQATFEANVRNLPEYEKGPEFQDNKAKLQGVYEQIYGKADTGAQALIHNTTKQGWTQDEFASWLRGQDAYKQTPEYHERMLDFMGPNGLGLITGKTSTLSSDQVDQMLADGSSLKSPTTPATVAPPTKPAPVTKPQAAPELVSEHGMWGPQ